MIDPVSTASASVQAGALPSLQEHAKPVAANLPEPAQAKDFARHMHNKPANGEAAQADGHTVRDRLSGLSKDIGVRIAQHERLEEELRLAVDAGNVPKSLEMLTRVAKDVAAAQVIAKVGTSAADASVSLFQSMLRANDR